MIWHIDNPRVEAEEHYYNPDRQRLLDLGYKPTRDIKTELRNVLMDLIQYRDRIEAKRHKLEPKIKWAR
jgi:hypothetical protein